MGVARSGRLMHEVCQKGLGKRIHKGRSGRTMQERGQGRTREKGKGR